MNRHSPFLSQLDSDLLCYMVEQNLEAGDRVPALSDLSGNLSISVSKLREQLEVARVLGIVEVRPRTGIRCLGYDFMPAMRQSLFYALAKDRKMFELFSNLRIHVEVAYWHEATALLYDEDKVHLRKLIDRAWTLLRDDHIIIPHKEHREFHMGIFSRLENPFVQGILKAYWEAYEAIEFNRYADYAYLEKVWTYHEQIADAINANDIDASLEAFKEHTKLLRHQPDTTPIPAN